MKKFWIAILGILLISSSAHAVNMVKLESYLNVPIRIIGIPDCPPFSYYESNDEGGYDYHSIFYKPLVNILKKYKNTNKKIFIYNFITK